jgi:hypothetical protein
VDGPRIRRVPVSADLQRIFLHHKEGVTKEPLRGGYVSDGTERAIQYSQPRFMGP